jgi:hypothetical protein
MTNALATRVCSSLGRNGDLDIMPVFSLKCGSLLQELSLPIVGLSGVGKSKQVYQVYRKTTPKNATPM